MITRKHFGQAQAKPGEFRRRARVSAILAFVILLSRPALAQDLRVQISSSRAGRQALKTSKVPEKPAVVTVDVESYVEGVLAGEASVLQNRAALQAMAVLVRTWAIRHRGRHAAQGFDFCSLTHCQVFRLPEGGAKQYPPALVDAAASTRNEVLLYNGRPADPYFTADCGGMTESAAEVWPDRNRPYLLSAPDPYCLASRHTTWEREITLAQVTEILRDDMHLPLRGSVRSLAIISRDPSGRAHTLSAVGVNEIPFDANQFRYAVGRRLGWDVLKSNLYTIELRGNSVMFNGRGLGHGVGLCEAGADAMAGMGMTYQEILAHYFPGTTAGKFRPPTRLEADPSAASEHFELLYPGEQEKWVGRALSLLEDWRRVLVEHPGVKLDRIRVETWNSTAEFIRATGEPGWVAGTSDGQTIFLQPLTVLAGKNILDSTLRHELTHAALHRLRAPGVPAWFEEGLVMYLDGEPAGKGSPQHFPGRTLAEAFARPQSGAEMGVAYSRAAFLVRGLAAREGSKKLWQVLEAPTQDDLKWLNEMEEKPLAP